MEEVDGGREQGQKVTDASDDLRLKGKSELLSCAAFTETKMWRVMQTKRWRGSERMT